MPHLFCLSSSLPCIILRLLCRKGAIKLNKTGVRISVTLDDFTLKLLPSCKCHTNVIYVYVIWGVILLILRLILGKQMVGFVLEVSYFASHKLENFLHSWSFSYFNQWIQDTVPWMPLNQQHTALIYCVTVHCMKNYDQFFFYVYNEIKSLFSQKKSVTTNFVSFYISYIHNFERGSLPILNSRDLIFMFFRTAWWWPTRPKLVARNL
jgi:hypothetical protein